MEIKNIDLYWNHVRYFFDTQLNNDIMNLPQEEKYRIFQMFHDYSDILEKLFHPGIDIIEHVLDKRWHAATTNPHPGINWDYECPIINEYEQWKVYTGQS
jgi:hypothetical protein